MQHVLYQCPWSKAPVPLCLSSMDKKQEEWCLDTMRPIKTIQTSKKMLSCWEIPRNQYLREQIFVLSQKYKEQDTSGPI